MITPPKVCIIVLNWNGLKDTIECLESLRKTTYPNYEVVVVDNGSSRDEVQPLREKYADYIHIIENDRNYGFAEGNNIAIRYALKHSNPDYLLLLNNDTVVDPEFLGIMVDAAENDPHIGILGPKVYFHANPSRLQSAGGTVSLWTSETKLIGWGKVDTGQFDHTRDSGWIVGCALLIRRKLLDEIGLLYPGYFAYFEEAEWCVRCLKAGYRVVYAPGARVWHKSGKSATSADGFQLRYMTRNRFLFMKRNASRLQYLTFLICFFFGRCPLTVFLLLAKGRNPAAVLRFFKAVAEGMGLSSG